MMIILKKMRDMKWGQVLSKDIWDILAEYHPDGDFTEDDLWEAIAETEGVDVNEIMDRDLTEFI